MDLLGPVVLATIVVVFFVIYRAVTRNRDRKHPEDALVERQRAIQSVIDILGDALESSSTTIDDGQAAALEALTRLRELEGDGDLSELMTDTEDFFNKWLAARTSR